MYGGNMFELLDEGSAASKAQNQKKDKKPAAVAAPAPAKTTAAPAKPAGGAQKRTGNSTRGRGRGGAVSEGRGRGAGGDKPPADRNKDRDRRQRDQAAKRGDYGAPDQQGHVKRPYDKFSHSAAGRFSKEGGRPKKDGRGPRNWGDKDTAPEDAAAVTAEQPKNEEDGEKAEAVVDENAPKEEEDEKEIDYQEFLQSKKKEKEELDKLVAVQARKVEDDAPKNMKVLTKNEEVTDFALASEDSKKKAKKGNNARNGKVSVDEVLRVQAPQKPREGGGRGRGGAGRGGKPNGGGAVRQQRRQDVSLSLNDDNDFPSLGGK